MKLGIVGGGVVGQATARAFIEHVDEVRVYDVVKERKTHSLFDVCECDLIFVCLPTPQRGDELAADLRPIVSFFLDMPGEYRDKNFVLRSTVPIGTTRRLREQHGLTNLVHSPEFLTARCAMTDAQIPARNVIGLPPGTIEGTCLDRLKSLYQRRFLGVPLHVVSSDESEAVKLFQNGFFAVKVAYWNEVRALADKLGLGWDRIMGAILADGRIAHSHTKVPGPDGLRGFGGGCLPKDLASLIRQIIDVGQPPLVTQASLFRNNSVDRKRDV